MIMTKANFILNNEKKPYAFRISGHAEYGNYGEDIVCSGITTATFTTLNLFDKLLKQEDYSLIQDEDTGLIDFKLNKIDKKNIYNCLKRRKIQKINNYDICRLDKG